jgi:hypothetical protein
MAWIKAAFLTGLLSTLVVNLTPDAMAADRGRGDNCRRGDRLQIQDLDMSPDPVVEGQHARAWKVRMNFEGRRECETKIYVREGKNVVGHVRNYRLRPGVNEIEIPAAQAFRFKGRESCLNVQADVEGTRQQIDTARKFCARPRTVWSMREPEDRGGFKR